MGSSQIVRKGAVKAHTGTKTNKHGNMYKARMPKSAGGGMGRR